MSFWQRLFGKSPEAGAVSEAKGPVQLYLKKYQNFKIIMAEGEAAGEILQQLRLEVVQEQCPDLSHIRQQTDKLLQHLRQALDLLQEFCRKKPENLFPAYEEVVARINDALNPTEENISFDTLCERLRPLLFTPEPQTNSDADNRVNEDLTNLQSILEDIIEQRLQEMFCLSLKSRISKKQAASLITGRLVPILVIDVGGGLAKPDHTVHLEDVVSIPYKAFLTGMLSIPWPKARPVDMKGFISVVGVTSTTPRAEDQLQKVSSAILAREYMNFSLCLGYHASTIESYVNKSSPSNYIRFHYEGGAASVERRVRRLRLIQGILSRLGFEVSITGDLLDGRKVGEDEAASLKMLEILGRLEVFTKQMDMVMTDDEVVFGYIDDFMAKHC